MIPFLFTENFQSFDDYANRPYYATFIRWLKYVSFFLTILLPGFYVSIATFHPELFPTPFVQCGGVGGIHPVPYYDGSADHPLFL